MAVLLFLRILAAASTIALDNSCATARTAAPSAADLLLSPLIVTGTVRDFNNSPIEGADVIVAWLQGIQHEIASAKSDAVGRFTILTKLRYVDSWTLGARKDGFGASKISSFYTAYGEFTKIEIGAIYLYPPATVDGLVTDKSGKPVPGANVYIDADMAVAGINDNKWPDRKPRTRTDANGTFTVPGLSASPARISVEAPGFTAGEIEQIQLRSSSVEHVKITLGSVAPIVEVDEQDAHTNPTSVIVRARRDGSEPLPGIDHIKYSFTDAMGTYGGIWVHPRTSDGLPPSVLRTAIDGWDTDPTTIHIEVISCDGEWTECKETELPKARGSVLEFDATFPKPGSVIGKVITKTGAPVPGARVLLRDSASQPLLSISKSDGTFQFDGVFPRKWRIKCEDGDWTSDSQPFTMTAGTCQSTTIVAERACKLSGRICINGKSPERPMLVAVYTYNPSPNPRVDKEKEFAMGTGLFLADCLCESDGGFAFNGLPSGEVMVVPGGIQHPDGNAIQDIHYPAPRISQLKNTDRDKPWPWIVKLEPDAVKTIECNVAVEAK